MFCGLHIHVASFCAEFLAAAGDLKARLCWASFDILVSGESVTRKFRSTNFVGHTVIQLVGRQTVGQSGNPSVIQLIIQSASQPAAQAVFNSSRHSNTQWVHAKQFSKLQSITGSDSQSAIIAGSLSVNQSACQSSHHTQPGIRWGMCISVIDVFKALQRL